MMNEFNTYYSPAYKQDDGSYRIGDEIFSGDFLPPNVQLPSIKRIIFVTAFLFSMIAGVTFTLIGAPIPYDKIGEFIKRFSYQALTITFSIIAIALCAYIYGVAKIMHRIINQPNYAFGTKIDPSRDLGVNPWIPAKITDEQNQENVYLNISTLDTNGNGVALAYMSQDWRVDTVNDTLLLAATPAYLAGRMTYVAGRAIAAPVYAGYNFGYEKLTGAPRFFKKTWTFANIPYQLFISIKQLIEAPLYAGAYAAFGLYSLYGFKEGSVYAGQVEMEWNNNKTFDESYFIDVSEMVHGDMPQPLAEFEGAGDPNKCHGFPTVLGKWHHPAAVVEFKNWNVTWAGSTSAAVMKWKQPEIAHSFVPVEYTITFDPKYIDAMKEAS